MKTHNIKSTFAVRSLLALAVLAMANTWVFAQVPNDSSLRLWLKADTLTGSTQDQTDPNVPTVPEWTSSDSYGTMFAVPPLPAAYDFNDQSNHTPQLVMVTNNGVAFQAVRFRQANDPVQVPNHKSDRLWQTNNLGAGQPTFIDTTNDITMIVVYNNTFPNGVGPYDTIVAMRSSSACPYALDFNQAGENHAFLDYAGSVVYALGDPIPNLPDQSLGWGIVEMNITSGGTLTMRVYYPQLYGWRTYTETNVPRAGAVLGDPLTLACHTQGGTPSDVLGNGAYERFAGYIAEVQLYNRSLTSNELAGDENYLLSKYFLQSGPPTITRQPQGTNIQALDSFTLSVLADGTPPFTYQWLKNGTPIVGANNNSFGVTSAGATNSGTYSVIVSNNISFVTSSNAVVTVNVPTNMPTIVSALIDYTNHANVTVTFSALLKPGLAGDPSHYTLSNGVTVLSATTVTNTSNTNYVNTVILTTSGISAQNTLTVNGVQDQFGNTASNAQATVLVPGAPGTPPSENRVLWLAGDMSCLADAIGVYEWDDQSGAPNEHSAFPAFGNVKLGEIATPNAMHPSLSFDGNSALQVDNTADLNLQTMTIYIVGDVDATKRSDDFIATWPGFVLGGSDGVAGALKWATWANGGVYQVIDPSPVLQNRIPTLIIGASSNPGIQTLTINGTQVGSISNSLSLDYSSARGVTIGALFPTPTQNLIGDVQEVLIYSSVSPAQDAAVQQYLAQKYFYPSLVVPKLVSAARSATTNNSVVVTFSSSVLPSTATNAANYSIGGGVTVNSVVMTSANTVTLTTSPITATQVLTVNNVTDWAGNAVNANSQVNITVPAPNLNLSVSQSSGQVTIRWSDPTVALQSSTSVKGPYANVTGATSPYTIQVSANDGLYVYEAEHFANQSTGTGTAAGENWVLSTSPTNAGGDGSVGWSGTGTMQALPNDPTNLNLGTDTADGPRMNYNINITDPGTYYVWVRGFGDSAPGPSTDDSLFMGIDGAQLDGTITGFAQGAGYVWSSGGGKSFTNLTAGAHVINIAMRETGMIVDKFILTKDPNYVPTGMGPAEGPPGSRPVVAPPIQFYRLK
jgi:hypothetical protein